VSLTNHPARATSSPSTATGPATSSGVVGPVGSGEEGRWRRFIRHGRDRPLWMLTPAGLAILVIIIVPAVMTIWLSLLNVNVSTLHLWLGAPWYGIKNFTNAFTQPSILGASLGRSIFLSFAFSILTTVIITPIGLLAAFSVHRPFRARGLVRAVYLIPYVLPTFVTGLIARISFTNSTGLVDRVLSDLGISGRNTYWLIGPHAFWAMLLTEIWATWPFIYLMALAGLQAIPREHYEAAVLDGASYVRKIRHVVLPEISGVMKLALLLSTLFHFGNFTLVYVMFSSPPPSSVEVLPINAYFNAFSSFDFGIACAIAVVTMIILIIPAFVYIRATRISAPSA
jgi:multiple sugar transport system permease protein